MPCPSTLHSGLEIRIPPSLQFCLLLFHFLHPVCFSHFWENVLGHLSFKFSDSCVPTEPTLLSKSSSWRPGLLSPAPGFLRTSRASNNVFSHWKAAFHFEGLSLPMRSMFLGGGSRSAQSDIPKQMPPSRNGCMTWSQPTGVLPRGFFYVELAGSTGVPRGYKVSGYRPGEASSLMEKGERLPL